MAKADERTGSTMVGSQANAVPDISDYGITYFHKEHNPFYNNPDWVEEHFSKPLVMQMEAMRDQSETII